MKKIIILLVVSFIVPHPLSGVRARYYSVKIPSYEQTYGDCKALALHFHKAVIGQILFKISKWIKIRAQFDRQCVRHLMAGEQKNSIKRSGDGIPCWLGRAAPPPLHPCSFPFPTSCYQQRLSTEWTMSCSAQHRDAVHLPWRRIA